MKIRKWRKNYPLAETSNNVIMFADVCIDLQNLFDGIFWRHRDERWTRWNFTNCYGDPKDWGRTKIFKRKRRSRTVTHSHLYTSGRKLYLISFFIRPLTYQCGYVYGIHASYYDDNVQCYSWLPTTSRDYLSSVYAKYVQGKGKWSKRLIFTFENVYSFFRVLYKL